MRADPAVFRRCGVLALCLAPWLVALPAAVAAQAAAADPRLGSGPAPAFGLEQMRRADPLDMRQSLPVTQPDRRPQAVRGTGGEATAPMSAIDWLDALTQAGIARPGAEGAAPFDDSGDIAESALTPEVRTLTLSASDAGAVGLLPASVTGLPTSLWEGADTAALIRRIERLEVDRLPAMQSLLYTLLLAEADPPEAGGPQTEDDPLLLWRASTSWRIWARWTRRWR